MDNLPRKPTDVIPTDDKLEAIRKELEGIRKMLQMLGWGFGAIAGAIFVLGY